MYNVSNFLHGWGGCPVQLYPHYPAIDFYPGGVPAGTCHVHVYMSIYARIFHVHWVHIWYLEIVLSFTGGESRVSIQARQEKFRSNAVQKTIILPQPFILDAALVVLSLLR